VVISLYKDAGGVSPSTVVKSMWAERGVATDSTEPRFKEYVTYKFDKPVVLNKGTWWAGVTQRSQDGFELGASKSRMAMKTTVHYVNPNTGLCGENGYNFMIDKQLRKNIGTSSKLQNNNIFCYENIAGYNNWVQFMPTVGNPAYAHLHHRGYSPTDGQSQTMSRGTWLPMIRPYFGDKSYTPESNVWQPCEIPVELTSFTSESRLGAIDLMWETASETNNYGFYIDRRREGDDDNAWKTLSFVKGANNTNTVSRYNYSDVNVRLNTAYQYRLRQIDADGSQGCYTSNVITEVYNVTNALVLEPNTPNPFSNSTAISFTLPAKTAVKLEVIDMLGNVVKTIVDSELDGTNHSYNWDSRDNNGRFVESGTYMFRLTAGQEVLTGKMSLVR